MMVLISRSWALSPDAKAGMGVSNHQLGLVISAALIGLALGRFSPARSPTGWDVRKSSSASVFFFGFWTIATAFSHNVEQMMFFRFMTGLGLGAAMPNIGTLVSEYAQVIAFIYYHRHLLRVHLRCGGGGFSASWLIPSLAGTR